MTETQDPKIAATPAADAACRLYVCVTCRQGSNDLPRPGARLFDAIAALAPAPGVDLVAVECLAACGSGCAAAFAAPGKWTQLYGRLDPDRDGADLLRGAALYAASANGEPAWFDRPEILRKNGIGRIPPLDFPASDRSR